MKFKNSKKLLSLLLTFMLIVGVTVCAAIVARAEDAPTIAGPTGMTTRSNTGTYNIGPYEITGDPTVTATFNTNNGNAATMFTAFAWNPTTKMISFNLTGGANNTNYWMTLTATNGGGTATYRVHIRNTNSTPGVPAAVNPPAGPALRVGYGLTQVAYNPGADNIGVSLIAGTDSSGGSVSFVTTMNMGSYYTRQAGNFVIQPGLPVGTYTFDYVLNNFGASTSYPSGGGTRSHTFTFTVVADTPNIIAPDRIPATSNVAAKMHLAPDYSETVTTGEFRSNASIAPATISLVTDNIPEITMESAKLVVAPGLAPGEYPITVRATNYAGTADVVYTVKVWDQQPTVPTIDGPNGAFFRRSGTYNVGPFNVGGYPAPSVSPTTIPSNFNTNTYDAGTNMLTITTGNISNNSNNGYVLTASNEYGSATHEIRIRGSSSTSGNTEQPPVPSIPAANLSEGYPRTEFAMQAGTGDRPASVIITDDSATGGKVSYYMGSGSGNGAQNGKFIVQPGLMAGSYPVVFTVTNFGGNDRTGQVFMVNVSIDEPSIETPASVPSTSKVAKTMHIGPLTAPVTSPAFVMKSFIPAELFLETTEWPEITLNDANQLVIAPGLAPGVYPITVRASNGIGTDPTATYNIKVWDQTPKAPVLYGPANAMTQPGNVAFFMGPWEVEAYPPIDLDSGVWFGDHYTSNSATAGDRASLNGNVSFIKDSMAIKVDPKGAGLGASGSTFSFNVRVSNELGDATQKVLVRSGTSAPQAANSIQINSSASGTLAVTLATNYGDSGAYSYGATIGNSTNYTSLVITEDPTGGLVKWRHSNNGTANSGSVTSPSGNFVIQPGLAPGVYVLKCLVTNYTNSKMVDFTITVTGFTGFSGPSQMTLPTGYAATVSEAFSLTGGPTPTVAILSGDPAFTWDSANKKLNIAAGLAPGEYVVELQATNTAGSDTLTFTLVVESAPPAITGTESLTIRDGYASTSSDAFTITGAPEPVVTLESDYPEIAWNDNTKKLEIAAGLAQGEYTVVLTAANGEDPDATLTFTIKVVSEYAPIITGASQIALQKGYGATTSQYLITGAQPVTAVLDSAFEQITWDDAAKRLLIAPGLAEGKYPVTLTATNGQNPDHVYTITLVVETAKNAPVIFGPNSVQYKQSIQLSADQPVTWKSNSKNLTVDANGNVRANYRFFYKTAMAATLTATGVDNGLTTEYHVRIYMSWPQWILTIVFFGWIWM